MSPNEPEEDLDLRLNVGSGGTELPGFINIDRALGGEAYPLSVLDPATGEQIAFETDSVSEIRASHILEHFPGDQVDAVLAEWVRVLKPGGRLRVAVPDFRRIAEQYVAGEPVNAEGYVMGGGVDANDHHHTLWVEARLRHALTRAGLMAIERWSSDIPDCASLPVSLNLEGHKPSAVMAVGAGPALRSETVSDAIIPLSEFRTMSQNEALNRIQKDVMAIMTLPRVCFTESMLVANGALRQLGIPMAANGGVFWDQCLTRMFELFTQQRYLLIIDYDSIFSHEDILELYKIMEARPDIDALCPVQIQRNRPNSLSSHRTVTGESVRDCTEEEKMRDTIPLLTGHFGLTLLRPERLIRLDKPWFVGVPDEKGEWGPTKHDPDITFWERWRAARCSVHQANRVVIGHLQLVISWPAFSGQTIHQYIDHYSEHGAPKANLFPPEVLKALQDFTSKGKS